MYCVQKVATPVPGMDLNLFSAEDVAEAQFRLSGKNDMFRPQFIITKQMFFYLVIV